jgi:hypothetical protein
MLTMCTICWRSCTSPQSWRVVFPYEQRFNDIASVFKPSLGPSRTTWSRIKINKTGERRKNQ